MGADIQQMLLRKSRMEGELRRTVSSGWYVYPDPIIVIAASHPITNGKFWVLGDSSSGKWTSGITRSTGHGDDLKQEAEHPNVAAAVARALQFI